MARNLTQFTEIHDQGGVQARYYYNNNIQYIYYRLTN